MSCAFYAMRAYACVEADQPHALPQPPPSPPPFILSQSMPWSPAFTFVLFLWFQEGLEALASVESSLEASLVCLMIVTCPGLDRKLCSDELIDCCLGLFRCGAM